MEKPLISVIVPCYNLEAYLAGCVESILAQTYDNLEIILVNDGSKDRTGEIIDGYAKQDARIVVIHQENKGASFARMSGVEMARGDYIGFVDGDDTIRPDMYERLWKQIVAHGADISHCSYQIVYKNHVDDRHNSGEIIVQEREKGLIDLLNGTKIEPSVCTKIYKKSLFENLVLNLEVTRFNEDILMNFYLFSKANCAVYEDTGSYQYIKRAGSSSTGRAISLARLREPYLVGKEIASQVNKNSPVSPYANKRYYMGMIRAIEPKPSPLDKECQAFRKTVRKELKGELPSLLKNKKIGRRLKIRAIGLLYAYPVYKLMSRSHQKSRQKNNQIGG